MCDMTHKTKPSKETKLIKITPAKWKWHQQMYILQISFLSVDSTGENWFAQYCATTNQIKLTPLWESWTSRLGAVIYS